MLYFITTSAGFDSPCKYLASWGAPLRDCIDRLTYTTLLSRDDLPPGGYLFADLERLDDDTRRRAAELWQRLHDKGPDYRLLNHPTQTMRRYELLDTLAERGVNQHRAYRASDGTQPERFPVFLRREDDHAGTQSELLNDQRQLDEALTTLRRADHDLTGWLIVEFLDTADSDGIYRTYATFNLGGMLVPAHVLFSSFWVVKTVRLVDTHLLHQETEYLDSAPREDELRAIFELARVDYGRIDYSLVDGKVEVWEINTNPILTSPSMRYGERVEVYDHFQTILTPLFRDWAGDGPTRRRRLSTPLDRMITSTRVAFERFRAAPFGANLRKAKRWALQRSGIDGRSRRV